MSKVGELLDRLNSEAQKHFPEKPKRIIVGRQETYSALSSEIDFNHYISYGSAGERLFSGIPIGIAGGKNIDFDFKIEF